MLLNIIQPIATLHNDDGTLRAVRVFKVKVEYQGETLPKQYSERSMVRFTDLTGINITKWLGHSVVDVSVVDTTKNRQLRSAFTSHRTSDTRIRGTYAAPAIKADGNVLRPNIYQVIGTIQRKYSRNIESRHFCIPNAVFIDYKGNMYTAQQLIQLDNSLTEFVRCIVQGSDALHLANLTANMLNEGTAGIGNINIINSDEPDMTLFPNMYISEGYARALSTAELVTSSKNITRAFSHELHRNALQYSIRDGDLATDTTQLCIPFGTEVARIAVKEHSIQHIIAQQGLCQLTYTGDVLPTVTTQTPLLIYNAEVNRSNTPLFIPPMHGVPCSNLYAKVGCRIIKPLYAAGTISLTDNIYDAGIVRLDLQEQPCDILKVPLGASLLLNTVVSNGAFTVIAERAKCKYQRPVNKSDITCHIDMDMSRRQRVLLNFEASPLDSAIDCTVCYAQLDKNTRAIHEIQHTADLPSNKPCGGDITLLLNTKMGCLLNIGTNTNMTVQNRHRHGEILLTYKHSIPEWEDVSTQRIVGDVETLGISLGALPNVQHTVVIYGCVSTLIISVDCDVVTASQLAQMLQIYTKNDNMQLRISIARKICSEAFGIAFMKEAWHDIKTWRGEQ